MILSSVAKYRARLRGVPPFNQNIVLGSSLLIDNWLKKRQELSGRKCCTCCYDLGPHHWKCMRYCAQHVAVSVCPGLKNPSHVRVINFAVFPPPDEKATTTKTARKRMFTPVSITCSVFPSSVGHFTPQRRTQCINVNCCATSSSSYSFDSLKCARLQSDHSFSRACNHNALRHLSHNDTFCTSSFAHQRSLLFVIW